MRTQPAPASARKVRKRCRPRRRLSRRLLRNRAFDAPLLRAGLRRGHRRGRSLGLRRHEDRRVEQYGVLAQQATARPARFDQDRDERLGHRAVRGDFDGGATVAAALDGERERRQVDRPVDAVTRIQVGAGQLRPSGPPARPQSVKSARSRRRTAGSRRSGDGSRPDPARTASRGTAVRPTTAGAAMSSHQLSRVSSRCIQHIPKASWPLKSCSWAGASRSMLMCFLTLRAQL